MFGKQRLSVDEELEQRPPTDLPLAISPLSKPKPRLLSTAEILLHYGAPNDATNLTQIDLPYPFRLDWAPGTLVRKITIHKKIADRFLAVCRDLLAHYGQQEITRLGIDQFAGCLNFRPQRGLEGKYAAAMQAKNYQLAYTYLSRHSWATAIDLDADRNQLKWKAGKAEFSKPEYKPMIDIFYKHGFISYGRERNNDYMHFEIGILL